MIDDTEKAAALNIIFASHFLGCSHTSACTVWAGEGWLRVGGTNTLVNT